MRPVMRRPRRSRGRVCVCSCATGERGTRAGSRGREGGSRDHHVGVTHSLARLWPRSDHGHYNEHCHN
eukprot:2605501-Rhodomonas_salina.4